MSVGVVVHTKETSSPPSPIGLSQQRGGNEIIQLVEQSILDVDAVSE
jgi:hypothetical protein